MLLHPLPETAYCPQRQLVRRCLWNKTVITAVVEKEKVYRNHLGTIIIRGGRGVVLCVGGTQQCSEKTVQHHFIRAHP